MAASWIARANLRVIATLLAVAFPALVVAGSIAWSVGQGQLRDSYGRLFVRMAEQSAAAVDAFVFRRIVDVATLAKTPLLGQASERASEMAFDQGAVEETDRTWTRHIGLPPDAAALLDSAESRFLHDVVRGDPIYREILVADRFGRLVAASGVTSDYFQGDEQWWLEASGQGLVTVSDVAWDESAQVFAVEVPRRLSRRPARSSGC